MKPLKAATNRRTRRQILLRAGAFGGSAIVYELAMALGWLPASEARAETPFALRPVDSSCRPKVAIIGAGLSGLVAGYELGRAGYEVTILEASERIGGRNLTARKGTVIDELGNPQVCTFDDHPDLYFNCGPARIPGSHHRVLAYCRELGVPLENFVNNNPNAYIHTASFNGGRPMRQREYLADAKGFLAELTSKALNRSQLDKALTAEDAERLNAFLASYGDLNPKDMRYQGSERAGYANGGVLTPGVLKKPSADLFELLKSPYWRYPMFFTEGETQFPSMMQPVGGMDRIVQALTSKLRAQIITGAMLQRLRVSRDGVELGYLRGEDTRKSLKVDYCFNCMPGHLVNGLDHNLPADVRILLSQMRSPKLTKVGLQMKKRFWEEEEIYGGITWTDKDLLQIWYPSHGTHGQKGVLLGGYVFGAEPNDRVSQQSHAERIEASLSMGEEVHPGRFRAHYETGVSISWQRYNHMLGCGSGFMDDTGEYLSAEKEKLRLREPVAGRYYMMGDQVSFHPGWQEGAIATAQAALEDLQKKRAGCVQSKT